MQQHPTPDWCLTIKGSVVQRLWGAHHGVPAQRSSSRMKDHIKSTLFRRPNEFSDETTGGDAGRSGTAAFQFHSTTIGPEKRGWSQWVDATLARSLSSGVSNPKVFRGR